MPYFVVFYLLIIDYSFLLGKADRSTFLLTFFILYKNFSTAHFSYENKCNCTLCSYKIACTIHFILDFH